MVKEVKGMLMYRLICNMLKKEGWKQQRDGEVYVNGEYANNFGKDGEIIHISFTDWADEETYEDLFNEHV